MIIAVGFLLAAESPVWDVDLVGRGIAVGCGPRKPVSPLPSFASLVWFLVNQVKHVTIRDGKDKEPIKARFTPCAHLHPRFSLENCKLCNSLIKGLVGGI